MPKKSNAVIDASALLALLNAEPGGDVVTGYLPGSFLSAVNLAEVVGKLAQFGMPEEKISAALSGLGLEVVEVSRQHAWRAGLMKPKARKVGLSLADLICIALAQEMGLPVITSDRSWADFKSEVEVVFVR